MYSRSDHRSHNIAPVDINSDLKKKLKQGKLIPVSSSAQSNRHSLANEDSSDYESDDLGEDIEAGLRYLSNDFIQNEAQKMQNQMELGHFLDGIKFQFRLDSFEIQLLVPKKEIVRYQEVLPNWHFILRGLCFKTGILDSKDFVIKATLKEVCIIDYYKKDGSSDAAMPYAKNHKDFKAENDKDAELVKDGRLTAQN